MNVNDEVIDGFRVSSRDYFDAIRKAHLDSLIAEATRCESPIEQIMLGALFFMDVPWMFEGSYPYLPGIAHKGITFDFLRSLVATEQSLLVAPQMEALGFRLDFLVVGYEPGESPVLLGVECDGHEFHERTKDQARRDRSRDRQMLTNGLMVMRFTGQEIYRDARRCALEVSNFMKKAGEERHR